MPESKSNRVSIKIPEDLHHEIDIASATLKTPIYVLIERAWKAYVSSESSTPTKEKTDRLPPSGQYPHSGIAFPGKTPSMESPRPFIERISAMLNSVPLGTKPAVEECLLQIVKLASGQVSGVTRDEQQGAPNKPKHFKRLKKLHDKPANVEDISGEPA